MELKQIWEEALKIIKEETSPVSFETWIQPVIPCGIDGNQIILQVENTFFKEMLEKRYLTFIRNAIKFVTKNEYDIILLTEEEQKAGGLQKADLSSEKKKAMPFLKTYDELPGFFLPDSSSRGLVFIDKAKLSNLPAGTVVVTHCPPECFSPGERQELQQLLNENRIALLIAGHFHIDRENGNEHLIRGLDPDKAAGGAPALTVFEEINGVWKRQTIPCPAADPRNWSEEQKNGFLRNLGVSGMSAPLECLEQAAARQIGIFEFRFNEANDCSRNRLQQGIRNWRENGGHTLSASLPVCTWRDGELFGGGRMRRAIALALEMECDCVRIKMPEISLKDLASKAIRERFAELCREMFLPLKQAHCRIAFDNARMPYHIAVCKVEDNDVVFAFVKFF